MAKKLIILILVIGINNIYPKGISVFFLKDGSIIQGQIVNENQNRIFLKTEQGTIKILPSDVLGREDSANEGDLTFMSERLEYIQGNLTHLNGQVNHWNDSLKLAFAELFDLFKNLETLQNEFEIDLLRLNSQGHEQKKLMEYAQDDLVNQRVDISSNRHNLEGLDDTVRYLSRQFLKASQKLDNNENQSYLVSGNLSTIKKDVGLIRVEQKNQDNQINMMSGALANNIQEVIRVQGKFSDVETGVSENLDKINQNQIYLKRLDEDLQYELKSLNRNMDEMFNIFVNRLDSLSNEIKDMNDKSIKAGKRISSKLGEINTEFGIFNKKMDNMSKELRLTKDRINVIDSKLEDVESDIKRNEEKIMKMKSKIDSIKGPE